MVFLLYNLALLIYKVKPLFSGSLTLSDYDSQFWEAMAMVRALNNKPANLLPL